MHPTLDLYFFDLPVYTALVLLGALGGLATAYLYWRARSRRAARLNQFFDAALIVFSAGALGARAYHVALHWEYYAARPDEIAHLELGGLAMRGALIAGGVALAFYARLGKIEPRKLFDAAALGLAIGQAIGWAGALAQGANYGVVSDSRLAQDLPDLYGLTAPRFPLQLAEIILFALVFLGLLALTLRHAHTGSVCAAYLLATSAANIILGFQRGDETVMLAGWRVDQWVDVGLTGLAILFYLRGRHVGKVGINV